MYREGGNEKEKKIFDMVNYARHDPNNRIRMWIFGN